MNKKLLSLALLLLILLSACSSNSSSRSRNGSSSSATMSEQAKLLVGTIRLEDTEYAVTPEQAKELLPLWYVMKDLTESDSAAQEEVNGLTNQIQETLTADQVKAIADMNLTRQDMFSLAQGSGENSAKTNPNSDTGPGGFGGSPPEMGGGFPGGGGTGGTNRASNSSASGSSTTSQTVTIPSALFELIIKTLEKKINS